jgi:hypothetical protein
MESLYVAGVITGFADVFLPQEPNGISEIDADMYLTGLRQGEICELGRAVSAGTEAAVGGPAFSATRVFATSGRDAINTGFARTELPAIATAESDAAIVLRQAFRTTGALLGVSCADFLVGVCESALWLTHLIWIGYLVVLNI